MRDIPVPPDVNNIDWSAWKPTERAVLCFIRDGNRVLLIHKKTGLGTGKINAPGGRIEPGETAAQAAVREVKEEVCVDTWGLSEAGELFFQFMDGYKLHGTVFFASHHRGSIGSTPEADPFWCDIDKIPYDDMWEDDRHWLPQALDGKTFKAFFIFDGDRMLSRKVIIS